MTSTTAELLNRRAQRLGPNFQTFYDDPVHLVRGQGVWLWDAEGRKYLDCYNNVPHVGHCHPHVVDAICRQAGTLNTHTRYLHEGILDYADRLTALMDPRLSTLAMTCTGSEANDIALRMAEAVTGKRGLVATNHTYHGNTTAVAALSRTNAPGTGTTDHIRFVPAPDSYRDADLTGGAFARSVEAAIAELQASEYGFAGIILCPYFANEGFPDLPAGYLDATVAAVRKAGGIVIADEVQPGFGRLGTHMWGHEKMGFVPDVVTMGKPMGNGHPVAGVVTSPEILGAFRTTFRYFNTFGGNPVCAAAAHAVLDVMETEGLMQNAAEVGEYARAGLRKLAERHDVIGNVRGSGLFFGVELVLDRATRKPATDYCTKVVNAMRSEGILLNKLGVHYNVLKIRPPMPFSRDNADQLVETLGRVLSHVRPG